MVANVFIILIQLVVLQTHNGAASLQINERPGILGAPLDQPGIIYLNNHSGKNSNILVFSHEDIQAEGYTMKI